MNLSSILVRRKSLKEINYLELTPIRKIEHCIDDNQIVTLMLAKFKNNKFNRFFIPRWRTGFIKIKLDEIGSYTWLLIDENTVVSDICIKLSEKFGQKVQPVEERVTKFLTQLYRQRYIIFKELRDKQDLEGF